MNRFLLPAASAFVLACASPALADVDGTIVGIAQQDGTPLAGVTIHLDGRNVARTVTTDARGRFIFARVPLGRYTVYSVGGTKPITSTVEVGSGIVTTIRLEPAATPQTIGAVTGTTRGVNGTPVSENAITGDQIATLPRGDSLDGLVESVPGIVRFSYDEPVVHGFHGLLYELDGAPLPQSTDTNFSELVDPRDIEALDIYTGAIPAEFGGQRMGAVVNVVTRPPDLTSAPVGAITLGAGDFATAETRLDESFHIGSTAFAFSANENRDARGIDAPTPDNLIDNDNAGLSDQFLRVVAPAGKGNQLAFDLSNQAALYQIPINTNPDDPNDSLVSVPGTDDVQIEEEKYASASFTHTSDDGLGQVQIIPWLRSARLAYLGDIPDDILATAPDPNTGLPVVQNGLRQDQRSLYLGLRTSVERSGSTHSFKYGVDVDREIYHNTGFIELGTGGQFNDDVNQAGFNLGVYAEDRWSLGSHFALNYGLRLDRSTGFVSAGQLSPRTELNYSYDRATVYHVAYDRFYAAPNLEDTRADAVITQTSPTAAPVYDLQPERDDYVEVGLAHTYRPGFTFYVDAWQRNVMNVLDTTQLNNTPLFAVFNNAVGHANGLELRIVDDRPHDAFYLSSTLSTTLAGGVSGGTFLFAPSDVSDTSLQPEDHDQAVAINAGYTHKFGQRRDLYLTLEPEYGTGYPVTFQDGSSGRLPAHTVIDAQLGQIANPAAHRLGINLDIDNLLNHQYIIKINNGFNTTQYFTGRRIVLRFTEPV